MGEARRGAPRTAQGDGLLVGVPERRKERLIRMALMGGWAILAVAIPAILHPFGVGPRLLPMHGPVLLAGATLGPAAGLVVGAVAPWLSFLLTGMPPLTPPVAPFMVFELMAYGGVAGALRQKLGQPSGAFWRAYLWLVPSLAAGRLALWVVGWLLGPSLGLAVDPTQYVLNALVTGAPGLVLQLAVIPPLVRLLDGARRAGDAGNG